MGFHDANGDYADTKDITLFNGTLTGAGTTNGDPVDVGDRIGARLTLDVTAAGGSSPTLDCKLQTRRDAADTWRDLAGTGIPAFAQRNGTPAAERKSFVGFDRQIRLVSTVGGTGGPTFTFSVTGELV